MPTAGTPAIARPSNMRSTRRLVQFGATAQAMVTEATMKSDVAMSVLRPMASDRRPAMSRPDASAPLPADSDRLATLGDTAKTSVNTGIIGCTQ